MTFAVKKERYPFNLQFGGLCLSKRAIYQDVFIYIKFYISMSRLDYIYQDLHTRKTRFQYTYQDPLVSTSSLINIDQLPLTRIDNQILHRSVCTDIKIRIFPSRSSLTLRASRSNPGGHSFFFNYFCCDNNNN